VNDFLDLMAQIATEQRQEATVYTSKFKGCREVMNLECSINYDAMDFVLPGARLEGPCSDEMICGFCGLVMLGCLGFHLYLGFTGVFPLLYFFLFGLLFV
jgi:hypothetical protein